MKRQLINVIKELDFKLIELYILKIVAENIIDVKNVFQVKASF